MIRTLRGFASDTTGKKYLLTEKKKKKINLRLTCTSMGGVLQVAQSIYIC
jgi:hypothetical protein